MPTGIYIRTKPDPKLGRPLSEEHRKHIQQATLGENNPFYGKHHSEESREKISKSRKGKCAGKDNPMFGKHASEETRKKQSDARLGRFSGKNHPMYGKPVSEETRKKISESKKGFRAGIPRPEPVRKK